MEPDFDSRIHQKFSELATRNNATDAINAISVLVKLLKNISQSPDEQKFRSIKRSNKVIAAKLLSCDGIFEILDDIGYTSADEDTLTYLLRDDERLDITLVMAEVALQEIQDSIKTPQEREHEKKMHEIKMQAQAKERERKRLLEQAALDRREASNKNVPTQSSQAVYRGPGKSTTFKDIGLDLNKQRKG